MRDWSEGKRPLCVIVLEALETVYVAGDEGGRRCREGRAKVVLDPRIANEVIHLQADFAHLTMTRLDAGTELLLNRSHRRRLHNRANRQHRIRSHVF